MRQVVAAIITREPDNQILICQRKKDQPLPLKWEFPGGKIEPGEEPIAALRRELHEELGIDAVTGEQLDSYEVRYGDGPRTLLLFFRVTEFAGEPQNLDFEQIVWERPDRLRNYDFLEGDLRFLARFDGTTAP